MTRLEKEIILNALVVYDLTLRNRISDMLDHGENTGLAECRMQLGIADSVLKYWPDVVDSPCGSIAI